MHSRSSDRDAVGWGRGDPLSAVLLDLRLSGTFFCNSQFGAPWSLAIAARDFSSFHFVAQGECWLQAWPSGAAPEAVRLEPGDLVLVPRSPRQVFASSKRRTGTPIERLPARQVSEAGSVLEVAGRAGSWLVICGGVRFEGFAAALLVELLPDVLVLRRSEASPIVAGALQAMLEESLAARPGAATLMTRLADVVVVQAIRGWLERAKPDSGWLGALGDAHIGRALAAVHREPERAWSLAQLAKLARLSRSRFSQRFSQLAGTAPMQYVTRVQMHRASELLRGQQLSVGELAKRFGYDSEPAFARAFKRHVGRPPGSVRREAARRRAGAGEG
jgi:AraC-like DNA-binding protein